MICRQFLSFVEYRVTRVDESTVQMSVEGRKKMGEATPVSSLVPVVEQRNDVVVH